MQPIGISPNRIRAPREIVAAPSDVCPFCAAPIMIDFLRSRFRVDCARCGVRYELTAAVHKRAKALPFGLRDQIRAENARGRTPCISMPDIESVKREPRRRT